MNKLTVLVDMDDVLENLCEALVSYLNMMHNRDVRYEDVNDWNISKFYPELTKEEVFQPLLLLWFWRDYIKPKPGAAEYLKKLIDDGHRVFVVTASHPDTVKPKTDWLFRTFPFLTYKDVVIAQCKQLICGDIIVDDNPDNLNGSPCKEKILFDAPHNRKPYTYMRLFSWEQIYEYISGKANEKSAAEQAKEDLLESLDMIHGGGYQPQTVARQTPAVNSTESVMI